MEKIFPQNAPILPLLNLTAAFNTDDHDILIQRLHVSVSTAGPILNWFSSYLKDRSFNVSIGSFRSAEKIFCWVPQESVLEPLLLNLYMLPLGIIINKHYVSYHPYADDTQMYISLASDDLNCSMSRNFLELNRDKTEILIGRKSQTKNVFTLGIDQCIPQVLHSDPYTCPFFLLPAHQLQEPAV
uniref:Uncharacterized protein n=1 Tax=Seriola dumerili TaxID=41447 RepID=A0A3B4TS26_SERDU